MECGRNRIGVEGDAVKFKLEAKGDDIVGLINKLENAVDPTYQKLGEAGRIALESINYSFDTNGRGTWKENAPSTKEGIPGILQYTGRLRNSMQLTIGKNYAEVRPSNDVFKYAAVNHYGSKAIIGISSIFKLGKKRGKKLARAAGFSGRIPARPFMRLWSDHIEKIFDVIEKPIDEAMK